MKQSGLRGPSAFLVVFGICVATLGALMFLGIPAANKMDADEASRIGQARATPRATNVTKTAFIGLVAGFGFIIWGGLLAKPKRPSRS